jgi:hypothetical protein
MQGSRQVSAAAERGERVLRRAALGVAAFVAGLKTEGKVTHLVTSDPGERGRVCGHLTPRVRLTLMRSSTVTAVGRS